MMQSHNASIVQIYRERRRRTALVFEGANLLRPHEAFIWVDKSEI